LAIAAFSCSHPIVRNSCNQENAGKILSLFIWKIDLFSAGRYRSCHQHIPEQSFHLVRPYGWYSNRMQGDRARQQGLTAEDGEQQSPDTIVINIMYYRPKRIPQLMWRECIKKVWEVDPLTCPKCAGEMRIISFIYQQQVIQKIFEHLKIYEDRPHRRKRYR
jgi:hypothetical protein